MSSMTRKSTLLSVAVVILLGFIGAWQRRWMSDDGLIVLRTVRNILAGNGPVFNAGERVEANTSTLWQYLIALVGWVLPEVKLEYIALWLSLLFTAAALGVAAWASAGLWKNRNVLLLPLGGLIYIALPPARDFATSGLEWGLSLLWIAVLWLLLVRWATAPHRRRLNKNAPTLPRGTLPLAMWAGLSWLIRPELALYGGLTGLLLLVAVTGLRARLAILAVALPIPAAYQVFRMGYYGLLVPHTAVAKSASEALWSDGWTYLIDLVGPYILWLPLLLALLIVVLVMTTLTKTQRSTQANKFRWRSNLAVVALVELAALLHLLYVIRVGGDFMHGRMLLLPLFTMLLPVAVMPVYQISHPETPESNAVQPRWGRYMLPTTWAAVGLWASLISGGYHQQHWTPPTSFDQLAIMNEREFWTWITGRGAVGDTPLVAEDFLDMPVVGDYTERIADGRKNNDAMLLAIAIDPAAKKYGWLPVERGVTTPDLVNTPLTLTMVNLGFTSMNAPLDVRVLDSVGLANPLAARQPRIEGGRVGHDKALPLEWQIADSAMKLGLPLPWIDQNKAAEARKALHSEDLMRLFSSYRAPMDTRRFLSNIKFSLTLGRTLELDPDPKTYAKQPYLNPSTDPIAWSIDIHLDSPR